MDFPPFMLRFFVLPFRTHTHTQTHNFSASDELPASMSSVGWRVKWDLVSKLGGKKLALIFHPLPPHFSVQGMSLTALFKAALFHAFSSSASLCYCLKTSWNHSPLLLWTLSILCQHLMFIRLEFLIILVLSCNCWVSVTLRYCVLILHVFCFTATHFALQFSVFLPSLRSVPLGEPFSLWWPLGAQSLAVGGPGSL